nr:hypothetical protein [Escherichia coli]
MSPFISVPVESLPSTVVLPLLFTVASSPLTCVPVPPLLMALSPEL